MKKKFLLIILAIFILFCFIVFLKSLNNFNTYVPEEVLEKKITSFNAKKLYSNEKINSDFLFTENKIYLLNIWASWCAPCRQEHDNLMKLSKNPLIKIIGLNYRDSPSNAKKFIDKFGNPYSEILVDIDGTIAINLGAYGVPETYIIDKNKKVLKKYVGALTHKSLEEIEILLK